MGLKKKIGKKARCWSKIAAIPYKEFLNAGILTSLLYVKNSQVYVLYIASD